MHEHFHNDPALDIILCHVHWKWNKNPAPHITCTLCYAHGEFNIDPALYCFPSQPSSKLITEGTIITPPYLLGKRERCKSLVFLHNFMTYITSVFNNLVGLNLKLSIPIWHVSTCRMSSHVLNFFFYPLLVKLLNILLL